MDYFKLDNIEYVTIRTVNNKLVQRLHGSNIPVFRKLSIEESNKWFKYVYAVQRTLKATTSRNTDRAFFESNLPHFQK